MGREEGERQERTGREIENEIKRNETKRNETKWRRISRDK
jgi:hypothetical protein